MKLVAKLRPMRRQRNLRIPVPEDGHLKARVVLGFGMGYALFLPSVLESFSVFAGFTDALLPVGLLGVSKPIVPCLLLFLRGRLHHRSRDSLVLPCSACPQLGSPSLLFPLSSVLFFLLSELSHLSVARPSTCLPNLRGCHVTH